MLYQAYNTTLQIAQKYGAYGAYKEKSLLEKNMLCCMYVYNTFQKV